MKDDLQLRKDVEAELEWDPRVDAREVGVTVKNGIVTLTGHVGSFAARWAAESAAGTVKGVRAIANEIEVKLSKTGQRTDTEIADAAVSALRSHIAIPADDIRVLVHAGWITLEGKVTFGYQKQSAERAVQFLHGVRGVTNQITIKPAASAGDIKTKIEDAFRRHAQIDAQKVRVNASDGAVTLSGEVANWQERLEAQEAAWSAPGVTRVENTLVVRAY